MSSPRPIRLASHVVLVDRAWCQRPPALPSPGSSVNVSGSATCPPGASITQINGQTFCNGQPVSGGGSVATCPAGASVTVVNGQTFCNGQPASATATRGVGVSATPNLAQGGQSVVVVNGKVYINGQEIPTSTPQVRDARPGTGYAGSVHGW